MTSPDDSRQAYADGAMDRWLESQGAHSLAAFSKPFRYITEWASPADGKLALVVNDEVEVYAAHNGVEVKPYLRQIGVNLLVVVNSVNLQSTQVLVATADGKHSTTVRYNDPIITGQ